MSLGKTLQFFSSVQYRDRWIPCHEIRSKLPPKVSDGIDVPPKCLPFVAPKIPPKHWLMQSSFLCLWGTFCSISVGWNPTKTIVPVGTSPFQNLSPGQSVLSRPIIQQLGYCPNGHALFAYVRIASDILRAWPGYKWLRFEVKRIASFVFFMLSVWKRVTRPIILPIHEMSACSIAKNKRKNTQVPQWPQ